MLIVSKIPYNPHAGVEMYKQMLAGGQPADLRRVLLAKWLYVHGFITEDTFPSSPGRVFVPRHLHDASMKDMSPGMEIQP